MYFYVWKYHAQKVHLGITLPNLIFMPFKPKRSSDNYIQFKRKISNPAILKIVQQLKNDWLLSENDIIYRFICEGAQKEIKKKEQFKDLKNENAYHS